MKTVKRMDEVGCFSPADRQDWRQWLELYHAKEEAVWVIFFKKKSPKFNLSWTHAVDEALCFGWIDSVKKSIDSATYKQYFTRRKPKSIWSKVNKEKVALLTAQGLMQTAGQQCVEIAKENGSWDFLNDVDNLVIPADLAAAFQEDAIAANYFEGLSNSSKKGLLYWILSAKRSPTRHKRIAEIVANARECQLPKPFRT